MPDTVHITALVPDQNCIEDGHQMMFAGRGEIAKTSFHQALAVWFACQDREVTVDEAAAAFRATPEVIREAVEAHYWLYLAGDVIMAEGL